jgi:hypothetical protein
LLDLLVQLDSRERHAFFFAAVFFAADFFTAAFFFAAAFFKAGFGLVTRESSDTFRVSAFRRVAPSVRLSLRAIWAAGVFAFANCLNSRTSSAVHSRRLTSLPTMFLRNAACGRHTRRPGLCPVRCATSCVWNRYRIPSERRSRRLAAPRHNHTQRRFVFDARCRLLKTRHLTGLKITGALRGSYIVDRYLPRSGRSSAACELCREWPSRNCPLRNHSFRARTHFRRGDT